jgi:hypothetical protein
MHMNAAFSLNVVACHRCDQREQNCAGCKCKADPHQRPFIELAKAAACPLGRHGDGAEAFIESMRGRKVAPSTANWIELFRRLWSEIHTQALAGMLTEEGLDAISMKLPCGPCAQRFIAMREDDPLPADPAAHFPRSVGWHNIVNAELGKPLMTVDEAKTLYATG